MSVSGNIIDAALRKLGNKSPTPQERVDALAALNSMIASWSAERLMVYEVTQENFPLVAGDNSYTIGPTTGDFDTIRPVKIESAYTRFDGIDHPLAIGNVKQYAQIIDKAASSQPNTLFYIQEFPLGRIVFDYVPDQAYTLFLDSWKPLVVIAALITTLVLPPEYERALIFNLAVEMASEYDGQPGNEVFTIAERSKAIIEGVTTSPVKEVVFDSAIAGGGKSNIITGESA